MVTRSTQKLPYTKQQTANRYSSTASACSRGVYGVVDARLRSSLAVSTMVTAQWVAMSVVV